MPPNTTRRIAFWPALFVLISAAAVIGALIDRVHPLHSGMLGPCAGAATILLAAGVTYSALARAIGYTRAAVLSFCLLAFAAAAEWCGITTGFPFGEYRYTGLWWPSMQLPGGASYPLFVPLAWYVFVVACFALCARRFRGIACTLATGLCAAIVDVAMEPVMTGPVGFWTWRQSVGIYSAPVQNFLGWFVTATCAAFILLGFKCEKVAEDRRPGFLLVSVLLFTIAIGCIYERWQALIGLPVLAGVFFTYRMQHV